jgi:hypothetical protein
MRPALAAILTLAAAPAFAAEYDCEGVFSQDTTLAAIEAEFGVGNVMTGEVPGPEGTTMIATTIYPDDPDRTMQVRWWNEANTADIAGVTLAPGDTGPGGVKVGMPIEEVQRINGEPFELFGFYWDYSGFAAIESGALSDLPGGCKLNLRFAPTAEDLSQDEMNAIAGDSQYPSDLPEMLAAKVVVREVNLTYPSPEEFQENADAAAE